MCSNKASGAFFKTIYQSNRSAVHSSNGVDVHVKKNVTWFLTSQYGIWTRYCNAAQNPRKVGNFINNLMILIFFNHMSTAVIKNHKSTKDAHLKM